MMTLIVAIVWLAFAVGSARAAWAYAPRVGLACRDQVEILAYRLFTFGLLVAGVALGLGRAVQTLGGR